MLTTSTIITQRRLSTKARRPTGLAAGLVAVMGRAPAAGRMSLVAQDVDRPVARADLQSWSAAVHAAAQVVAAEGPRRRDGEAHLDAAIAGVGVEIGGEALGQAQGHVAVAGADVPGRSDLRAGHQLGFDAAVAGVQRQRVQTPAEADAA